jgi:hypothetical protein
MVAIFAKIFGVLGLLTITRGVFIKKEKSRDLSFAVGGVLLLVYSIYLRDTIFIVLQIVFILSNIYQEFQINYKRR